MVLSWPVRTTIASNGVEEGTKETIVVNIESESLEC